MIIVLDIMMHRKLCFGLVAILASFVAGCSTVESRIKSDPQIYAALSSTDQALVRQGQIGEGMPRAAVFHKPGAILIGFGPSTSRHPFEAWIYNNPTNYGFTGLLLLPRFLPIWIFSRRGLAASSPFLFFWSLFVSLRPVSGHSFL